MLGTFMESSANTGFRQIQINRWRQFSDLDIAFHPRLTVLTGANASGKSTILNLLAMHFNWSRVYSSTPMRRRGAGRLWSSRGFSFRRRRSDLDEGWHQVGALSYANGSETPVTVPEGDTSSRSQYSVALPQQQPVPGVFLTSHRAVSGNYAEVQTIPALFGTSEQLFEQFTNEVRTRW